MVNLIRSAVVPLKKIRNLIDSVRRDGFRETCGLYAYRVHEMYRDRQLRIRTTGFHDRKDLGLPADCIHYQAIHYHCLDFIFTHLQPTDSDVFLDYGCGKGRAVVVAATYPFCRVMGVELSSELARMAGENLQSAARNVVCPNVEIIETDAALYEVPHDVTMVLLFNPFRGQTLADVQQQLHRSWVASPRRMQIVYMVPVKDENDMAGCDWLGEPVELSTASWADVRLLVYESRIEKQEDTRMSPCENL